MKSILNLFLRKNSCAHMRALIHSNEGYCPDCGAYVKKYFYIARCSCCEVKREAKTYFGEVLPKEKFCTNCGSRSFYVEKLESISFIDVPYAIHTKEIVSVEELNYARSQIWVDNQKPPSMKYLAST